MSDVLKEVSLISTVYNEADTIREFLESVLAQTKKPKEFIIVDAGSEDGTLEILREYAKKHPWIKVFVVERASIGRGRNEAISRATGDIIAVTDAGCVLDPSWLERITKPILAGQADVAVGRYVALAQNILEEAEGLLAVPENIFSRPSRWSSRSLAFRRKVWEIVGGYPDYSSGEDTQFNLNVLREGFRVKFVPDAVVYWQMRKSVWAFLRQFFRYGCGDGRAGNLGRMPKNGFFVLGAWVYVFLLLYTLVTAVYFYTALLLVPLVGYVGYSFIRFYLRTRKTRVSLLAAFLQVLRRMAYVFGAGLGVVAWIKRKLF